MMTKDSLLALFDEQPVLVHGESSPLCVCTCVCTCVYTHRHPVLDKMINILRAPLPFHISRGVTTAWKVPDLRGNLQNEEALST